MPRSLVTILKKEVRNLISQSNVNEQVTDEWKQNQCQEKKFTMVDQPIEKATASRILSVDDVTVMSAFHGMSFSSSAMTAVTNFACPR